MQAGGSEDAWRSGLCICRIIFLGVALHSKLFVYNRLVSDAAVHFMQVYAAGPRSVVSRRGQAL